jgi:hypothetical protein
MARLYLAPDSKLQRLEVVPPQVEAPAPGGSCDGPSRQAGRQASPVVGADPRIGDRQDRSVRSGTTKHCSPKVTLFYTGPALKQRASHAVAEICWHSEHVCPGSTPQSAAGAVMPVRLVCVRDDWNSLIIRWIAVRRAQRLYGAAEDILEEAREAKDQRTALDAIKAAVSIMSEARGYLELKAR